MRFPKSTRSPSLTPPLAGHAAHVEQLGCEKYVWVRCWKQKKNTANSHRCHQQEDQNGIWYLGLCCFISALLNFSYFQLVKVNVSATTFCCPFHYDYLLPTKMTSATFCCLFLVADQIGGQKNTARLFAVILVTVLRPKLKKGWQKVMQLFCPSKGCKKHTKRSPS